MVGGFITLFIERKMAVFFILLMCISDAVAASTGKSLLLAKEPSPCGDWKPYKDEKCLKIITHAGHQTKRDAEIVCQAFSEELNLDSYPRLLTVKTKEEQEFLQHFLFEEGDIVDNVWLGLQAKGNNGDFEWNDGTSVMYSNWVHQNITDDHHQCVQMSSGEEFFAAGLWVRVNCRKGAIVVCERTQIWSLENLQNMFLNYKLEQERKFNEEITSLREMNEASNKEIASLQARNEASEYEIVNLKRNPVPIGFVYVQLPNQEPPTTLWPQTKWGDVSSSYAGLFFRVMGGQAAPFGQVQEANTSRLAQVEFGSNKDGNSPLTIPPDGKWSGYIFTGSNSVPMLHLRFRLSGGEVRPRNQAVKVWQRNE